jgi:plasmid maintenance system antidote protein VapI
LNEIWNAKRPVSTDFALLIEAALGVNADLLVRLQVSYNMQVMRADSEKQRHWNEIRKVCAAFL